MSKRVATFYQSKNPGMNRHTVFDPSGVAVSYVRMELLPDGATLDDAFKYIKGKRGEHFMNAHYV